MDRMDEISTYRDLVKENIEYDYLRLDCREESDREQIDEIYELICEVVCMTDGTVRIEMEPSCQIFEDQHGQRSIGALETARQTQRQFPAAESLERLVVFEPDRRIFRHNCLRE